MSDTPVRVREKTYQRIKTIGDANRMPLIETIDVLTEAWGMLSPEQQRDAIQRRPELPKRARRAPAA